MALNTDLSLAPYFNDYSPDNKHYQVLFKPSLAIQARELNEFQTILQNQIEKFGDNIFKRGTIIEGCSVIYHSSLPYVKIKDVSTDSTPVNVESYKNLYVRNAAGVTAFIVDVATGYEFWYRW
jgi:hypothetical protein